LKYRIGEQWETYRTKVIPKSAGAVQLQETRRAFYAGAEAMYRVVMEMLSPESEPTEADIQAMQEIMQEMASFAKDVVDGKA